MELAAGGDLMEALQSHRTGFQVSGESISAPRKVFTKCLPTYTS